MPERPRILVSNDDGYRADGLGALVNALEDLGEVWVGYGRNTVLQDHPMGRVVDTLVDYVKAGTIRHFFLVGGCDGAKPGRDYYTGGWRTRTDTRTRISWTARVAR